MSKAEKLVEQITRCAAGLNRQTIVAIAGPPASGKSTISEELAKKIPSSIVLPMDGFHYDDAILHDLGLYARKGAPETFDVAGFEHLLARIAAGEAVAAPVFDRDLELSRGSARMITPDHNIVLVEGNYLLLNEPPWNTLQKYWDLSISLSVPPEILRNRLIERWLAQGLSPEEAQNKADGNDIPNAERMIASSTPADITV